MRIGIYFTNAISSATYDHEYLTHDMNHLSITTAMKITEERRTYSGRYIKRKLRGGGGACTVGVRFITLKSFTWATVVALVITGRKTVRERRGKKKTKHFSYHIVWPKPTYRRTQHTLMRCTLCCSRRRRRRRHTCIICFTTGHYRRRRRNTTTTRGRENVIIL